MTATRSLDEFMARYRHEFPLSAFAGLDGDARDES
jgi:hypothetical protein